VQQVQSGNAPSKLPSTYWKAGSTIRFTTSTLCWMTRTAVDLVYALATNKVPSQQITGGHFRVSISADGRKAERVDALSHGIITDRPAMPAGSIQVFIATSQLVSNIPVETFIYSSYFYRLPISVATPDGRVWVVGNGMILRVDDKDPGTAADILNKKKPRRPQ
jgi:hypothetical protein